MVRTDDHLAHVAVTLQQFVGAVPADIVEGAQLAVGPYHSFHLSLVIADDLVQVTSTGPHAVSALAHAFPNDQAYWLSSRSI